MIKIEEVVLPNAEEWQATIRGMRNPMNSWANSDSIYDNNTVKLGKNDAKRMDSLVKGGPVHAKFRRFINVYADITAPLYWWKEFDTYRNGVEKNSCSTMHKIHSKEISLDDFSCEHLNCDSLHLLNGLVTCLNVYRDEYLQSNQTDKDMLWQIIQLLPSSYNQRRTVVMSYEALANMYKWRNNHKLDEWKDFCKWAATLPYAEELIMKGETND